MNLAKLKRMRVIVSLVFLFCTALVFLDYRNLIPENIISGILYLQFVPSLLKFMNAVGLSVLGFIIVILLTLLFGRIYCSTICPLGIIQDALSWIARKFKKKRKRYYRYSTPHNLLRYTILAVTVLVFLFGSVLLISMLDPYSNFGRFMTYFLKPVVVDANNNVSSILEEFDIYALYPVLLTKVPFKILIWPIIVLVLVIWLSVTRGRLYCNTVCPVGALLGLMSKVSLFRIGIDGEKCTKCSLCARVCKSSCMNYNEASVDFTRCVGCYNCLTVCPAEAVKYLPQTTGITRSMNWKNTGHIPESDDKPDKNKRTFIKGSMAFFLGMAGMKMIQDTPVNKKPTEVPEEKEFPVSPPGSCSIENFNDQCTACTLCVSACPTNVLQPSFMQYGLSGIMQPHMDYHSGFCNYDCTICTDICPTGAILPVILEEKKLVQLGIAQFIRDNCIVHTDKTDCGACSEVCPTKSCHMVPYEGSLVIPEVLEETCIGCGACEFSCPTTPYKAIYVNGNAIHMVAEKPSEEELTVPEGDDWPF
ncbi:MAG: 4Fe-4S binding protein [Bacteroidales bacterium]|nr:MAG: 4Fe-4S binding protein [Bacteroidales bacterium]